MQTEEIPDAVRRLIIENIDLVPELEAILLLREFPEHTWTADEAGQRLYVSRNVAVDVLETMTERGFFVRDGEGYRYSPRSADLASVVDLLAVAYSKQLRAVTMLIHGKPSAGVRQFAEAFRLRKDK
jgi:hypothetical protein